MNHFMCYNANDISYVVRAWCAGGDYWDVYFDMNKKVYEQLPKRGLNFPYQTYTVNIKQ